VIGCLWDFMQSETLCMTYVINLHNLISALKIYDDDEDDDDD